MCMFFFFFKQKTAYELRISDWSSDVCSSDLPGLDLDSDDDAWAAIGGDPAHPQHGMHRLLAGLGVERGAVLPWPGATGFGQVSGARTRKIGRASCRERVCQSV